MKTAHRWCGRVSMRLSGRLGLAEMPGTELYPVKTRRATVLDVKAGKERNVASSAPKGLHQSRQKSLNRFGASAV
jgi:hypothetical protein